MESEDKKVESVTKKADVTETEGITSTPDADTINGNPPVLLRGNGSALSSEDLGAKENKPTKITDEPGLDTVDGLHPVAETMDTSPELEEVHVIGRHISDLPEEVLEHLLTFVAPYGDLRNCQLVCRTWYAAGKRVRAKLRRLLARSVADLSLVWFHYDTPSSNTCVQGKSAERVITRRCAHSAAMLGGNMYVFGGCSSRMTCFNDLWRLDPGTLRWHRPPAVGCYPSPKAYASMVAYKHRLYVFGGWSQATPYPLHRSWKLFDELHVYDTKANCWEELRGVTGQSVLPRPGEPVVPRWPPRISRHAASLHGHLMVVMGGLSDHPPTERFAPCGDLWVFDLETEKWRLQQCSEPAPCPRYGHSQLALDDRHMLLLGGSSGPNQLRQDAWLLQIGPPDTVWRWRQLKIDGGQHKPTHVWCHPACQVGDHAVVLTCPPNELPMFWNRAGQQPQQPAHQQAGPPPAAAPAQPGERAGGLPAHAARVGGGGGGRGSGPETGQLPRRTAPGAATDPVQQLPTRPSVRPNARDLPQLRLAGLQRMQERLEAAAAERAAPHRRPRCRPALSAGYRLVSSAGRRRMTLHVLDARAAISEAVVQWRSVAQPTAPDERILYSLVAAPGAGEIIMFGGIVTPPAGDDSTEQNTAYNSVSFITVPARMFH